MDNLKMRVFKNELVAVVNQYDSLPIEARRLVVKEVYDIVKAASEEQINRELEESKQREDGVENGISESV